MSASKRAAQDVEVIDVTQATATFIKIQLFTQHPAQETFKHHMSRKMKDVMQP